jgi:hypothetical protein
MEVEDRLMPGHWEGDLLKGAFNRSAVGTLVERSSRLVLLVWVENASTLAALEGFSRVLNGVPELLRKTLTYDQGKEMSEHARLTAMTGVAVFFADPHTVLGNAAAMRTPMGSSASTCPKAPTCPGIPRKTSTPSPGNSTTARVRFMASVPPLQVYNEMLQMVQRSDSVLH